MYPFRHRHPLTGHWVRARYLADLSEIAARYPICEIIAPAQTRRPIGSFSPHNVPPVRLLRLKLHSHVQRTIDADERRLVCPFLRRYVVWCARRRQCFGHGDHPCAGNIAHACMALVQYVKKMAAMHSAIITP